MPVVNPSDISTSTIFYSTWKPLASNNRVRYFEFGSPTRYFAAFGKLGVVLLTRVDDSGDVTDFETDIKPGALSTLSETEVIELSSLDATIGKLDGRQQKAYEFATTVIYIGYADFGVSQASTGWTIKKINLDTNGNPQQETWTAVGAGTWTNRTSETYL